MLQLHGSLQQKQEKIVSLENVLLMISIPVSVHSVYDDAIDDEFEVNMFFVPDVLDRQHPRVYPTLPG